MQRLLKEENLEQVEVFNLGTGKGSSVLEVIQTFEKISDQKLPYTIVNRRDGDVVTAFADTQKANAILGWETKLTLEDAIASAWNWEKKIRK